MAETVNQETTKETAAAPAAPERTFTQAELDAIVGDRLSRERQKYADYDALKAKAASYDAQQEAGKSELQKAQEKAGQYKSQLEELQKTMAARDARDKVSAETGVPASLLTADTEEACKAQAEAILQYAKGSKAYPETRDAGEVTNFSGGATRDKFADWFGEITK